MEAALTYLRRDVASALPHLPLGPKGRVPLRVLAGWLRRARAAEDPSNKCSPGGWPELRHEHPGLLRSFSLFLECFRAVETVLEP